MLTAYLKRQWKLLLLLAGAVAVFAAVFALYGLPVEAVAYAGLLCLVLGLILFALGYSAFSGGTGSWRACCGRSMSPCCPCRRPGASWRRTTRPCSGPSAPTGCALRRRTGTGWRT